MLLFLVPAAALTLLTLLIVALWRVGLALRRRPPAPRFWKRAFAWHLGLLAAHLFLTAPLGIGYLASRFVGTRNDEAAYAGPRIGADGTWQLQTRETLASEPRPDAPGGPGEAGVAPVWLTADDGVKLRSFLVPPRAEAVADGRPRFVTVLVHGLYRGGLEIETPGAMLRDLGGEVLLLELRNHGGSGRSRPTFGLEEARDVVAAAEFLRGRPEARDRSLVVYAISMGTAAAALAAPRIPGLAGLVLDAPMDELGATTDRMLGNGIPQPWRSTLVWSARYMGGVPFDQVKPRDALGRLTPEVAVLLIGAGKDDRMPADSVRALFDGLPTRADRKELWIEPDATHGKVWVAAPDEYRRRLGRFLDRIVPAAAPPV